MAYSMEKSRLPEETPHEFMTLQSDESFARRNQSSVAVDRDAIDHEHILRLKRERANAKRALTNVVKEVSAALVCQSSENGEYLAQFEERLEAVFTKFEQACELFKATLSEEDDIDECCAYFNEAEARFLSAKQRLHAIDGSEVHHIQPDDSVSQISVGKASKVSKNSSSSSLSSVKSVLGKKMLHNATRKAALIAEGSLLARKQSLAYQEMKLTQMKEELKLQEELMKLEAEDKVMSEVFKSDGQITPSVFNTDKQGSLSGTTQLRSADVQPSSEQFVVSGFINQPTRSITERSPMRSKDGAVRLDALHNLPVATERKKNPCKPSDEMPMTKVQIHKSSEPLDLESKPSEPRTSGLSNHQFTSLQSPTVPTVASPWLQHDKRLIHQPLIDDKRISIAESPKGSEKQQCSPSCSSEYGDNYLATMKRLAEASMLPKCEFIHFDGNALRYYIFMKHFESQVEKDTDDNGRRLQLLIQYCNGKARKVVESCILLGEEEGYKEAKRLLEERFGSKYKVSSSWISKVSDGPSIQPNDREALMDLADDLQNCEITLRATGRLNQVNNEDKLVRILERCPGYIRARWQTKVQDIREEDREPNIEDVRRLIKKVAVEKNDPVFGGIMDGRNRDGGTKDKKPKKPTEWSRTASKYSMNYNIQTKEVPSCEDRKSTHYRCYHCEGDHKIKDCERFNSKSGEEQLKYIRQKKLCDNCLSPFHFSAGCKRKTSCTIPGCNVRRKHMSSIHEAIVAFEIKRDQQLGADSSNTYD